ncbi:MAG TPA: hypothetical protein VMW38_06650 [Terriglobia bacterium]|nr:hypothetical protein [Terriglobia bacterium]
MNLVRPRLVRFGVFQANPTFGQLNGTRSSRVIQLLLRLQF